ncbi:hypothetical protein IGK23_002312 [Enterococcus sp. DIV1368c]
MMSFWISITERVDLYVIEQNGELLEAILRDFFPYLKKVLKMPKFQQRNWAYTYLLKIFIVLIC